MATITQLKKSLDRWFSLFIRLRYAQDGIVRCFTCGKQDHYKSMHCGHFQSRRHLSTRWDEINCQVQCPKCNTFNQGEQYKFAKNLDKKYGKGTADGLARSARMITKMTQSDYKELIDKYKSWVNTNQTK